MAMSRTRRRGGCGCRDARTLPLECPVHGDGDLNDLLNDYAELSAYLPQGELGCP